MLSKKLYVLLADSVVYLHDKAEEYNTPLGFFLGTVYSQ